MKFLVRLPVGKVAEALRSMYFSQDINHNGAEFSFIRWFNRGSGRVHVILRPTEKGTLVSLHSDIGSIGHVSRGKGVFLQRIADELKAKLESGGTVG